MHVLSPNSRYIALVLFLTGCVSGLGQSTKEYIRLGGRIIAVEYALAPGAIEETVTPSPAAGTSVAFTVQDVDPASASDIEALGLLINNSLNGAGACYFRVEFFSNGPPAVEFFGDDGVQVQIVSISPLPPSRIRNAG